MSSSPAISATLANAYAGAARAVSGVLAGASLADTLALGPGSDRVERAAVLDLSATALRAYGCVDGLVAALAHRGTSDPLLMALLYVAIADLREHPQKGYAIVDEAVKAARLLERHAAAGFVNALLRQYQRRHVELEHAVRARPEGRYAYPGWWVERVQADHPGRWEAVLAAGNARPAFTLRVNQRRIAVARYLDQLHTASLSARHLGGEAVRLDRSMPVETIPGFRDGLVSVQDAAAQRAARYLDVKPGQQVLDACAAPGGKAGHLLELYDCRLTALDAAAARMARVRENLARLGLHAQLIIGDACNPDEWWDGAPFDRVLADVPCSASGIVRRHPDIKWLRRPSDIEHFARLQGAMLASLWRVVAPGGKLLYVTCSVFAVENRARIDAFQREHPDAREVSLPDTADGQLLPCDDHDGFFYALLEKR